MIELSLAGRKCVDEVSNRREPPSTGRDTRRHCSRMPCVLRSARTRMERWMLRDDSAAAFTHKRRDDPMSLPEAELDRVIRQTSRTFALAIPRLERPLSPPVGLAYLLLGARTSSKMGRSGDAIDGRSLSRRSCKPGRAGSVTGAPARRTAERERRYTREALDQRQCGAHTSARQPSTADERWRQMSLFT